MVFAIQLTRACSPRYLCLPIRGGERAPIFMAEWRYPLPLQPFQVRSSLSPPWMLRVGMHGLTTSRAPEPTNGDRPSVPTPRPPVMDEWIGETPEEPPAIGPKMKPDWGLELKWGWGRAKSGDFPGWMRTMRAGERPRSCGVDSGRIRSHRARAKLTTTAMPRRRRPADKKAHGEWRFAAF
jgi:hypothetical protein